MSRMPIWPSLQKLGQRRHPSALCTTYMGPALEYAAPACNSYLKKHKSKLDKMWKDMKQGSFLSGLELGRHPKQT